MKEPGRSTQIIFTTQDRCSVPLKHVLDILQLEEGFTVEEYKHTQTHATSKKCNENQRTEELDVVDSFEKNKKAKKKEI